MMKSSIAIVDDDRQFTDAAAAYLIGRGYSAKAYYNFDDIYRSKSENHKLLIVDINLQDGDGLDLLRYFKQTFPETKIIIITGFDSLQKRLQSFGLGADDYMKKPIFPAELEARIKRLLALPVARKNAKLSETKYTKDEREILEILLDAKGEAVSLDVMQKVNKSKAAIYTLLSRLKKKIAKEYEIKAAYGRGWYIKDCA